MPEAGPSYRLSASLELGYALDGWIELVFLAHFDVPQTIESGRHDSSLAWHPSGVNATPRHVPRKFD